MQPSSFFKSTKKRGRGRPRTTPPTPRGFSLIFSFKYAEKLSMEIAQKLGIIPSDFTDRLVHITLAYGPMRALQKRGCIKKGCTRRSRIHLAVLLLDVSMMYAELTGSDAQVELKKINGFREERRNDATVLLDNYPPVEILARIVMAMWGDEKEGKRKSLQRQARMALKLI